MSITTDRSPDGVAVVTIDRPDALNAFDEPTLHALLDAFRRLGADPTARVVVLTGAGDRAFAAGADIKAMATMSRDEGRAFGRLGQAVARAIETCPKPVVAAVNGFALGGGCELALACDIRIASESAQFGQPEVSLGIPPGWGGTQRLPRLVGPGLAAEIVFTGRRVKADEALRIGLVNAVVAPDALMETAGTMAARIAANGPAALAAAKAAMAVAFDDSGRGYEAELAAFAEAFTTEEQREGMAAFVEKRRPVWPS